MIKKHLKCCIYVTYQRTFWKHLWKKTFESTKENRAQKIKSLTLLNYWSNQTEKLIAATKIFLLKWLRKLQYENVSLVYLIRKERFLVGKTRSSHRRCSVKKGVLKHFANFIGKHRYWSLFLIKLQAFRPGTFLKRDSNTVFSCEIREIYKNTYFEEQLRTTASEKRN